MGAIHARPRFGVRTVAERQRRAGRYDRPAAVHLAGRASCHAGDAECDAHIRAAERALLI